MVEVIAAWVESDGGAGVELIAYLDGRHAGKFAVIVYVIEGDQRRVIMPITIRPSESDARAEFAGFADAA